MPARIVIATPGGFTPRVGCFAAQLEDVRLRTLEYVHGLGPEQLAWTPGRKVESIGTQLLHIAAIERSWIGEDIDRRPMGSEWDIAFPIRRGIDQIRDKPLEYFLETLRVIRDETKAVLSRLTDGDLAREIVPLDGSGAGNTFSLEWILYHVIEHEAHHKGQISLLKRLYADAMGRA